MNSNEIYKITNKVNGKIYIGLTTKGSGVRYRQHWNESRIGEPAPIHNAMRKYGEDNFIVEIIDFAETVNELKEKEKYYIAKYNATDKSIGYNVSLGGDGNMGYTHSEEIKQKLRELALNRPPASEETRRKISEANKGRKPNATTRAELEKHNVKTSKTICQFDKDLNFIAEYPSIAEAARQTGIDRTTIQKQLNGTTFLKRKKQIKFIWKLKEECEFSVAA